MAKWRKSKDALHLAIGPMGKLMVMDWLGRWAWEWRNNFCVQHEGNGFASPESACRAAERWLRGALKQAQKRVG